MSVRSLRSTEDVDYSLLDDVVCSEQPRPSRHFLRPEFQELPVLDPGAHSEDEVAPVHGMSDAFQQLPGQLPRVLARLARVESPVILLAGPVPGVRLCPVQVPSDLRDEQEPAAVEPVPELLFQSVGRRHTRGSAPVNSSHVNAVTRPREIKSRLPRTYNVRPLINSRSSRWNPVAVV